MEAALLSDTDLLNLDEAGARRILGDPEPALWVILRLRALARKAEEDSEGAEAGCPGEAATGACGGNLSTPSSALPAYAKPAGEGGGRPGRPAGHEGSRRAPPPRIDRRVEHELKRCPDCGGKVHRNGVRTRRIEEIEASSATATEHSIRRYFCKACRKRVEPKVEDALPGATIGNRTVALTAWLHYASGVTVSQVQEILSSLFGHSISPGGLT